MMQREYKAAPTIARFIHAVADIICIWGPLGSGKSVGACIKIFLLIFGQNPDKNGVRRSKGVIVRSTYSELDDTTLQTWLEWFPEVDDNGENGYGYYSKQNRTYHFGWTRPKGRSMRRDPLFVLEDGTIVVADILFRALERPEDVKKLLSLEVTWAWINEAREVPFDIVAPLQARTGRYPPKNEVTSPWAGIMMDTNPPDPESKLYKVFKEGKVDRSIKEMAEEHGLALPTFELFEQPDPFGPDGENLDNLRGGLQYYLNLMATAKAEGKPQSWIDAHVHGIPGYTIDGSAVYGRAFNDAWHVAKTPLRFNKEKTLAIGMDVGLSLHTAAVYGQADSLWRWSILGELYGDTMPLTDFIPMMTSDIRERFGIRPEQTFILADPAGGVRSGHDAKTAFSILKNAGYRVFPSEQGEVRRYSVRAALNKNIEGGPKVRFDRSCVMLIQGFLGGYHYRKKKNAEGLLVDKPHKNKYSHPHDALQYLFAWFEASVLKGAEHRGWLDPAPHGRREQPSPMKMDWDISG